MYEYLGEYKNSIAKDRDVETIKYILLNNGLKDIKRIDDCNAIFITTNKKMTFASSEYLLNHHIVTPPFFLPLLTDRKFAMLLWILTGGAQDDFSHLTLVSNCRRVVEQHIDLFHGIKDFLTKVPPEQVKIYESIINNDRAIYSLMDQAAGNPTLITESNFDEIFSSAIDEIEREAKEEERLKIDIEIEKIKYAHEKEIKGKEETINIYDNTIKSISEKYERLHKTKSIIESDSILKENENSELKIELENKKHQLELIQEQLRYEEEIKAEKTAHRKLVLERILIVIIILSLVVGTWFIPINGWSNNYFSISAEGMKLIANGITILMSWKIPDYVIKPIINKFINAIYP